MRVLITMMFSFIILTHSAIAAGKDKIKSVFVKQASQTEVFDLYTFPARIDPEVNSLILSETQGVVTKLPVVLGQKVKKGQIVAKVKNTDPVFKFKPVVLKSPINGVVSAVYFSQGSQVTRGEKLLLVTDPKQVKILIEIPSKDLGSLKKGMKGDLFLKSSKKPVAIEVVGISPYVHPATGTATAQIKTVKKDHMLTPGTLGKVSFKSNIHKGIMLPQSVLTYVGKFPHIRLVEEKDKKHLIKKVKVEIGPKRRGQVEILSGLKKGSFVVERSSGFIKDGDSVVVKNFPKSKEEKKKKTNKKDTKKKKIKVKSKKEKA
ncbi:MAG: HlyD family efflux transporter periplasmic adaptor subunit [Bacteriovoracaceae bacterium]|nr:HlyD family efflux transporter periplasmic adaptor subunit [Bacteriovoracaceae bacterium]